MNRSVSREEIPIPLTRPVRSRWKQFARAVCGVYVNGMGGEPARQLPPQEPLQWYERTPGRD